MAAAEAAKMAPAKAATVEAAAKSSPAMECQGGTARAQRRAQRGRGQQYTHAFHIILLPQCHFGRRHLNGEWTISRQRRL
jgi:hypothetical protein